MVVLAALVYLTALFAIAHVGESRGRRLMNGPMRPVIYALTLGVYCTSWTFLGSVGLSSRAGYDFLPIYIGPMLVVALAPFLMQRIVRLAKENNLTSIADFVASRYGKNQGVAAIVTLIAVIGVLPYVALQLKAISASVEVFLSAHGAAPADGASVPIPGDMAMFVALILAFFAIVFGTRQVDTTEHQDGLMIAIAVESAIKLAAFLAVGVFVTWWMFDGPSDIFAQAYERQDIAAIFSSTPDWSLWLTMTLLSAGAILMLPRQFHVAVVENRDPSDVRRAAWLFPTYLVAINLFVIPIAAAGLLIFPNGAIDRDLTVLALPLKAEAGVVALAVLIGGLSAATAMVIVECVALAIMISNDLFMPLALSRRSMRPIKDMGGIILLVRRVAIMLVLLLGYAYYRAAGEAALASIGLLVLRRHRADRAGPARRPVLAQGDGARRHRRPHHGPRGLGLHAAAAELRARESRIVGSIIAGRPCSASRLLKPEGLFRDRGQAAGAWRPRQPGGQCRGLRRLLADAAGPTSIERLQANVFINSDGTASGPAFRLLPLGSSTVDELRQTVSRYLGEERTRTAFQSFATTRNAALDGRIGGGPAHDALRGASARLGDRRLLVSPRAVVDAAPAQSVVGCRAPGAGRGLGRDPAQPGHPATCARPYAAGRDRLRRGIAAARRQPGLPRASSTCRRSWWSPAWRWRRSSPSTRNAASTATTARRGHRGGAGAQLRAGHGARAPAPAEARHGHRHPLEPPARRRPGDDLHRHHRRAWRRRNRWSAPTRRWSAACASARRS